ncbi:MAG: extracellular solute-binding protein [Lachnospiraceae bacterium]
MKKRKLMALLLAGGMVTSMLAGCGNGTESAGNDQSAGTEEEESSQDNENEGKVLTMMTYIDPNGGDATQEKVWEVYQRFTEETGIEIELNVVPWDQTESKVVITNQAGSPCDIALISSQKMPSLVNSGALCLRRTAVGGVKQLYMILISIFMLFPLLWGLLTSLKPQDEIFTYPPKIFGSLTLENYQWVFEKQNLGMSIAGW